jgi:hypothetical protein
MGMRTLLLTLVFAAVSACGSSSATPKDAAPADASIDAVFDASCFTDATTQYEIMNACTNAEQIFINTKPPLENPDGTLPPLPP